MKIEIEKIQKIKLFEPFEIKIIFENYDEAKDYLTQYSLLLNKFSGKENVFDTFPLLNEIASEIENELINQKFVHV